LDYLVGKVDEGYPAIDREVPAEWITLVRTGYAEGVAVRERDQY
jgi:hypothetical protein